MHSPPTHQPAAAAPSLLVSTSEAARLLRISSRTLWTLTQAGDVPCVRIGRKVLYSRRSLKQWVRQRSRSYDARPAPSPGADEQVVQHLVRHPSAGDGC